MPPLIAGAVAGIALGAQLAATSIALGVIMGLATFALSAASFFLAPNTGSFEQRLQGLLVTQRQAVAYGRRIFGLTRVGGVITFLESVDGEDLENEFLHMIITIAYHEIDEFITVYFDDYPIHMRHLDFDGIVAVGKYADLVKIQWERGLRPISGVVASDGEFGRTAGDVNEIDWQPFPDAQAETEGWTLKHKQMGRAKLYVRLQADPDVFSGGVPNITVVCKGTMAYDPRDASTKWSPNPALCIRHVVRSNVAFQCGLGAQSDEVNEDSFMSCANVCDERVTVNTSISTSVRTFRAWASTDYVAADGDGKYRYFPVYFETASGDLIGTGADIQTGDGVQFPSGTNLPTGLVVDTTYYIILKQFGQTPSFELDSSTWTTALGKEMFALGFATTYQNALDDVPIECTALVGGGTRTWGGFKVDEARYQCSGVFEYDRTFSDVLDEMQSSCGARLVGAEGKYKLVSFSYVAPDFAFSKDDLVAEPQFSPKLSRRDRFNTLLGVYSSPIHAFQPTAYPKVYRQIYIDNDDFLGTGTAAHYTPRTFDLPFTTSPTAAQRLARIALERARQEITGKIVVAHEGLLVTVGDTIEYTDEDMGFENKIFEITELSFDPQEDDQGAPVFGVGLTLKEHASAIFDWDPATDEQALPDDLATNTNLPNAGIVLAPTNFVVTEEIYQVSTGNGVASRVNLTWNASATAFTDHYNLQYRASSSSEYLTIQGTITTLQAELNGIQAGDYYFRIQTVNTAGVRSPWNEVSKEIFGLSAVPSAPTNVSVVQVSDALVQISWDKTTDLDVEFGGGVIIRHDEDEFSGDIINSVGIGSKLYPGSSTSAIVPNKTGTYIVSFIDSTGQYSEASEAPHVRANTLSYTTLAVLTESISFTGTKTNLQVLDDQLQLGYDTSTSPALDVVLSGRYVFANKWSSATPRNIRITTYIDVIIQDNTENIDDRTEPIDTWLSMDGVIGQECDARVRVRMKMGDPSTSPTPLYTGYQPVDCMFANAHDLEFDVLFVSMFGYANIKVATLYVVIEEVV